ncbi:glycoside hydrolase family 88/105 protein [Hymenobacter chitinivorans]|uniref:Rhamnogalacturonyl hydrolase YesR n=1 Tax=Hymenobacter chitinivorans DSM 11115 TaxID=1121954 RepID=A0A2M9BPS7_9BACT|nr:glycoside hydrolase family 88 protein [Hymenobacter chitinivorans]PJJ59918.1 rhamnogalacturonyl hydrolase YesR [Hymenobacter chitinivorans DSM 11115]
MKLSSLLTTSLAGLGLLGLVLTATPAPAQKLPKKEKVLKALTLTNDYFMQKWPDPGKDIMTNKLRPSHIWTRSVYYEGLMALYQLDKQKRYYDYAVDWAEKHKWGIRNGITDRDADNQCAGQTYIDLYLIDRKPERIRDIKASIDNMVNSPKVDDWSWIDALQMAMPVYAKLGAEYNDSRYYEKMYQIYNYSKTQHGGKGLFNAEDNLWWRDKDFVPPYKEPNGQDCYWSRGNGWVVAAMVRVLDVMPRSAPHRDEYVQMYMNMIKALPPLQRPDGFWNVSLHDETHFGGKELTGTALFVYGMAWGINRGLLDRKTYQPIIAKAWQGMIKDCLHPDGFLGYVQGTGKEPKDGQPVSYTSRPDFEDYGLGCFLLAGSEVYKLQP